MKELQIVAPEGYEVDKEKSTFEKIVFKKKNNRPTSWEKFCEENPKVIKEFYIDSVSEMKDFNAEYSTLVTARRVKEDKNLCKTEAEAEAFLALIQLRRLWHVWRDEPDKKAETRGAAFFYNRIEDKWEVSIICFTGFPIWFKSEETAKLFLETFKDLFDKVKVLYQ